MSLPPLGLPANTRMCTRLHRQVDAKVAQQTQRRKRHRRLVGSVRPQRTHQRGQRHRIAPAHHHPVREAHAQASRRHRRHHGRHRSRRLHLHKPRLHRHQIPGPGPPRVASPSRLAAASAPSGRTSSRSNPPVARTRPASARSPRIPSSLPPDAPAQSPPNFAVPRLLGSQSPPSRLVSSPETTSAAFTDLRSARPVAYRCKAGAD